MRTQQETADTEDEIDTAYDHCSTHAHFRQWIRKAIVSGNDLTAAQARIVELENMLKTAYGTILREVDMSHPDDTKFMKDVRAALENKP